MSALRLGGVTSLVTVGESGPHARPMDPSWLLEIRDQCQDAGVAFFFKQWGGVFKSRTGRELEGRTWNQMPSTLNSQVSSLKLSSSEP